MAISINQNFLSGSFGGPEAEDEPVGSTGSYGLKPTERLFIEKTLIQMYPRLQRHDLIPWKWFQGPLIPDFIVRNTDPYLRRIVEIGCGDGVFSNILSLLFPDIEIIGIDTDRDKIAYARSTIGYRQNVKFICANATVLADIPCDRIIYNHCLSRLRSSYAFKKLLVKTSQWIVDEGDFIVKESPFSILNSIALLKEFFPKLRDTNDWAVMVRSLLAEIGYPNPLIYQSQGLPGMPPSEIFYRASKALILTAMLAAPGAENPDLVTPGLIAQETAVQRPRQAVAEWQDWGDQSNDSLVGFLFSNAQADFSRELV